MAEQDDQNKELELELLAQLTTEIVTAYVTKNTTAMNDLGSLIDIVGRKLRTLGQENAEPTPAKPEPAVPVRRSIRDDHLLCLVCGKPHKILRRHLNTAHDLTPDAYRELFDLRSDYPMAAPAYRQMRSELALKLGSAAEEGLYLANEEADNDHSGRGSGCRF